MLALIFALLLLVLVVWDLTGPDSVIRGILGVDQTNVSDNARDVFESVRPRN